MDREGKPKPHALIEPGGVKIQRTRASRMIAEAEPIRKTRLVILAWAIGAPGRSCRSEKPQFFGCYSAKRIQMGEGTLTIEPRW